MTRPLSNDLRKRVVAAAVSGESCRSVASRFGVAVSSVVKWVAALPVRPARLPRQDGRTPQACAGSASRQFIMERIRQTPHLTLHALKDELAACGVSVSHMRCGCSCGARGCGSKKTLFAIEQAPLRRCPQAATLAVVAGCPRSAPPGLHRRDLDQDQHGTAARMGAEGRAPARLCSAWPLADANLPRCVALRPAHGPVRLRRSDHGECSAPMSSSSSSQGSGRAISSLWIISASHKSAALRRLIRAAGARLWYLPPYSPDLNPIEQAFAKIKHWMRAAQKRTIEDHLAPHRQPRRIHRARRMRQLLRELRIRFRIRVNRSNRQSYLLSLCWSAPLE